MRSLHIGILAEDATDCDAAGVLVRRIAAGIVAPELQLGIKTYSGKGCAKLRVKAELRMNLMTRDGCSAAILIHDLDRDPENGELKDESRLRAELERIASPPGMARLICIPVEEMEAWFWSDPKLIEKIGGGKGKDHPSPHLIKRPKEALMRLSRGANNKPRYSTNDNADLASNLDIDICARRCLAFGALRNFVREVVA